MSADLRSVPSSVRVIAPGIMVDGEAEEEFWRRPGHAVIRRWAHARMCSPHALLAAVVMRLLCHVPPFVVLPPIVGSKASLNLFVALVGPTSSGKDRALDVAAELLEVVGGMPVHEPPVGSGEGLVNAFAHAKVSGGRKETVRDYDAALVRVSEVDAFAALAQRKGSTLEPVVRSGFMAQVLGFGYRGDPTTLPAHTYRLGLVVGVQPEHGDALLGPKAISGGTAGRFLWTTATTNDLPPRGVAVPTPERVRVVLPEPFRAPCYSAIDPDTGVLGPCITPTTLEHMKGDPHEFVEVRVPAEVERLVLSDTHDRARGEVGDPLDGYGLLIREKVALGLALLDGRSEVGGDDWRLAEHVLDISRKVRSAVRADMATAFQEGRIAEAVSRTRAEEVARQRGTVWTNCYRRVRALLTEHSRGSMAGYPMSASALSERLSVGQRKHLEDVLEWLVEDGVARFVPRVDRTRVNPGMSEGYLLAQTD